MAMNSSCLRVFPKSTTRLDGDTIRICVTRRSMRAMGMENSSSMQSGMAPPQGLAVAGLRSKRNVSTPPAAIASAAEDPAGPPPITATRNLDVAMVLSFGFWMYMVFGFKVLRGRGREWRGCRRWSWVAIAELLGFCVLSVQRHWQIYTGAYMQVMLLEFWNRLFAVTASLDCRSCICNNGSVGTSYTR